MQVTVAHSQSRKSKTPAPSSTKSTSKSGSTSKSTKSTQSKIVTQGQFTPRTNRLANYSKCVVRERLALIDAFPKDRDSFIWEAVLGAAQSQQLTEVVNHLQYAQDLKELVLKYVSGDAK